ncbi:MAG: LPS-assembly protein LptD [Puniceicoccales bacterium]|jgi:LPS-assembly protein|nr:LPS-assembly protein LptD [Puniceicoccales bacterium]
MKRLFCGFLPVLACFSHGAGTGNTEAERIGPEISAERIKLSGQESGEMLASGKAHLQTDSLRLRADEIRYRQEDGQAHASHRVSALYPPFYLRAEELHCDLHRAHLRGKNLRLGGSSFYLKATDVEAKTDWILARQATLYLHEPASLSLSVRAKEISLSQSRYLEARQALFFLGRLPLFYARHCRWDVEGSSLHVKMKLGHDSSLGTFVQSQWPLHIGPHSHLGALFDSSSRRGCGGGMEFSAAAPADAELPWALDAQGYFIRDHGKRGNDFFSSPLPKRRGRCRIAHRQCLSEHFHVTSHVQRWSDSEIFSDFHYGDYKKNPFPDSFAEANYRHRHALTTLFLRVPPHRFRSATQRLPSLRFEYFPALIGETSLYQQGFIDLSHLSREDRGETFLRTREKNSLRTRRAELAYQLFCPVSWGSGIGWTPILGLRGTSYSCSSSPQKSFRRVLGQVGFDLDLQAHYPMDVEQERWGIHGLRHVIHPMLQYRWIPHAERHWDEIPGIDDFSRDKHLPILDLLERRDTDRPYRSHVLRLGIENFLQTAGQSPHLARDLLQCHLYQDLYPQRPIAPPPSPHSPSPHSQHLSHTYLHLQLHPAEFLQFQNDLRFDPVAKIWEECRNSCRILSGERWQLQIEQQYLRQRTRSYSAELSGCLDAVTRWKFFFQWDARRHRLDEHGYRLVRQISQTWNLEAGLSIRHRDAWKKHVRFFISCNLIRW